MSVIFDPTKALKIKKDIKVQRMYATIQNYIKNTLAVFCSTMIQKKMRSQKDKQ